MRITEDYLVDNLHELIDNCDPKKLSEIASVAFGGDCNIYYDLSDVDNEELVFTFDPGISYHGELGESEYQTDDLEEE